MTQTNIQHEIKQNDSLSTLERDVKAAFDGGNLDEGKRTSFSKRLINHQNILKKEDRKYTKWHEKNNAKAFKLIGKTLKFQKKMIFWNALAIFVITTNASFGSFENGKNSGSFLGLIISGIDKHEIFLGYWIFLFYLIGQNIWNRSKTLIFLPKNRVYVNAKMLAHEERINSLANTLNEKNLESSADDKIESLVQKLQDDVETRDFRFLEIQSWVLTALSIAFPLFVFHISFSVVKENYFSSLNIPAFVFLSLIFLFHFTPDALFIGFKIKEAKHTHILEKRTNKNPSPNEGS